MTTIALFDFDGTLTYKDSFRAYLQFSSTPFVFWFKNYLLSLPYAVLYKFKLISTHKFKEVRLKLFLTQKSAAELERLSNDFATIIIPKIIKKSGLERINWHKAEGHQIWIVSASFDIVLEKWCNQNNIGLLTNKAERNNSNRLTGHFPKPDCNYEEKVHRIKKAIDLQNVSTIYAYGDTSGDRAMLNLAHYPHFCFFD